MKLSAEFEIAEHEEYGMNGLRMVGRRWSDPLPGMAVAHDIMEHGRNDDGSTEHELMALGASLLVRNGSDYYARKGQISSDPAGNIAADMPDQWRYMQGRGQSTLRDPGRTAACDVDEDINDVWRKARKLCRSEFEPSDFPAFLNTTERAKFIGWLRRGYRMAVRRFRGVTSGQLCDRFADVERLADKFLSGGEAGYRCRITVTGDRATLREIETPDYY